MTHISTKQNPFGTIANITGSLTYLIRKFFITFLFVIALIAFSITQASAQETYRLSFTFIEFGNERLSPDISIAGSQEAVFTEGDYKITAKVSKSGNSPTLNLSFALKQNGTWHNVAKTNNNVKIGALIRYDLNISDKNLKDSNGDAIKRLRFAAKLSQTKN